MPGTEDEELESNVDVDDGSSAGTYDAGDDNDVDEENEEDDEEEDDDEEAESGSEEEEEEEENDEDEDADEDDDDDDDDEDEDDEDDVEDTKRVEVERDNTAHTDAANGDGASNPAIDRPSSCGGGTPSLSATTFHTLWFSPLRMPVPRRWPAPGSRRLVRLAAAARRVDGHLQVIIPPGPAVSH